MNRWNKMGEITRSFKKEGTVVKVKAVIPDEELSSKDVLETLQKFEAELQKIKDQEIQLEKQKEQLKKGTEHLTGMIKDLGKHKEWALEVQQSKVKAILNEIKDEAIQAVRDTFVPDKELDADQNKRKMYLQLENVLFTNDRMRQEIYQDIAKKAVYTDPIIENPFK